MSNIDCIYLHGFASGPNSKKATYFAEQLRSQGVDVHIPDLNGKSFEHMTLTSQIELVMNVVDSLSKERPLILFGSSMGGLVATLVSHRTKVEAMILLAPGFSLLERWRTIFTPEAIEEWPRTGYLEVFHYAMNVPTKLSFGFVEDVRKYQTDNLEIACPTLVLHGLNDQVVPFSSSVKFKQRNPDLVEVTAYEDDHELLSYLPQMWAESKNFLSKIPAVKSNSGSTP